MKKFLLVLLTVLICNQVQVFATDTVSTAISSSTITQTEPAKPADDAGFVAKIGSWYTNNLNYLSVTLLMALESSFIPFPSEIVVPPAAYAACNPDSSLFVTDSSLLNILFIILFATLGAIIGAIINYYLAFFLGRPIVYWFADSKLGHLFLLNSDKIKKAEDYFVKHGNSSTLIGRLVPGIRQLISIPAGLAKMKIAPFLIFTAIGSSLWNIILALLGYFAHGNKDLIDQYSGELSWGLLALGVLFIAYLVYKGVKSNKNKKSKSNDNPVA